MLGLGCRVGFAFLVTGGSDSPVAVRRLLTAEDRLQGLRASVVAACGLDSCNSRALERRLDRGLVAPRHVGSFWTRDQTHVSCISRQIFFTTEPPGNPLYILNRIASNTCVY